MKNLNCKNGLQIVSWPRGLIIKLPVCKVGQQLSQALNPGWFLSTGNVTIKLGTRKLKFEGVSSFLYGEQMMSVREETASNALQK